MSLDVARKIMVNMPDEVFDMYLRPLIAAHGWPFRSVHDSTRGTHWFNIFDHLLMEDIAKLCWKRSEMPIPSIRFHPNSQSVVHGLITCHKFGITNKYSKLSKSPERFLNAHQFSTQTGRVPAPVVLMLDNGLYRILDGNHRIAGLLATFEAIPTILDCWVGHNENT